MTARRRFGRVRLVAPLLAAFGAIGMLGQAGCQTRPADGPARLVPGDRASLGALHEGLARALDRARIVIGPADPARSSAITVLPPPPGQYEMRSLAMPVAFDLAFRDGACVAIRRDTGVAYPLAGVRCVAP